jgi:hypothetical protein
VGGFERRFAMALNPDNPLGGATRLCERWRRLCGHFRRLLGVHGTTMDFSQATKLPRKSARHHHAPY